jgi:hypothetical protein
MDALEDEGILQRQMDGQFRRCRQVKLAVLPECFVSKKNLIRKPRTQHAFELYTGIC